MTRTTNAQNNAPASTDHHVSDATKPFRVTLDSDSRTETFEQDIIKRGSETGVFRRAKVFAAHACLMASINLSPASIGRKY